MDNVVSLKRNRLKHARAVKLVQLHHLSRHPAKHARLSRDEDDVVLEAAGDEGGPSADDDATVGDSSLECGDMEPWQDDALSDSESDWSEPTKGYSISQIVLLLSLLSPFSTSATRRDRLR